MDDPVFFNADDNLAHATELFAHHESPVPEVDAQTRPHRNRRRHGSQPPAPPIAQPAGRRTRPIGPSQPR
jgi:hypothetical protein